MNNEGAAIKLILDIVEISIFICILLVVNQYTFMRLYRMGFCGIREWTDVHPITTLLLCANLFTTVYTMKHPSSRFKFMSLNRPTAPIEEQREVWPQACSHSWRNFSFVLVCTSFTYVNPWHLFWDLFGIASYGAKFEKKFGSFSFLLWTIIASILVSHLGAGIAWTLKEDPRLIKTFSWDFWAMLQEDSVDEKKSLFMDFLGYYSRWWR